MKEKININLETILTGLIFVAMAYFLFDYIILDPAQEKAELIGEYNLTHEGFCESRGYGKALRKQRELICFNDLESVNSFEYQDYLHWRAVGLEINK